MRKIRFTNAIRIVANERGDALVIAIVMAVACVITGLAMLQYSSTVEQNSRRPRVKSLMMATEAKVRELLMTPGSYVNCNSDASRAGCAPATNVFAKLKRPVTGARCATPGCGIEVSLVSFTNKTTAGVSASARVRIHYSGLEMNLADMLVDMIIPVDIIQSSGRYACDISTRPKFLGFNADGSINCVALPPTAAPGSFVKQINLDDLTMTAQALDPDHPCGANQVIGHVDWGYGGTVLNTTCIARPNPFTEFGFTPGSVSGDPVYTPNID